MEHTEQPHCIPWAQAFADTYLELSTGEGDMHQLLDWAYELYPVCGHRLGADVARDEFALANPPA